MNNFTARGVTSSSTGSSSGVLQLDEAELLSPTHVVAIARRGRMTQAGCRSCIGASLGSKHRGGEAEDRALGRFPLRLLEHQHETKLLRTAERRNTIA